MNVKLSEAQKISILNADDLYKIMQQVLLRENKIRRAQEHFWIVGLNSQNKVLFVELLALGNNNRVNITPPDAFRMAIYKLATKAVFVHNHPSGNIKVSQADKDLTDYLYKAGKFLKIDVIDHLVIAETEYTSFEKTGIMKQLRNSGVWELVDRTKAELNDMKTEIAEEKAKREQSIHIAKKMKAEGLTEAMIKKLTGLRLAEIRKL
jgi:DNA repair protein RadC